MVVMDENENSFVVYFPTRLLAGAIDTSAVGWQRRTYVNRNASTRCASSHAEKLLHFSRCNILSHFSRVERMSHFLYVLHRRHPLRARFLSAASGVHVNPKSTTKTPVNLLADAWR